MTSPRAWRLAAREFAEAFAGGGLGVVCREHRLFADRAHRREDAHLAGHLHAVRVGEVLLDQAVLDGEEIEAFELEVRAGWGEALELALAVEGSGGAPADGGL